ncbi:Serine phosphatase RsbU, regulator of sigma subunit [Candidatus Syntrophocurvum alkaliphilum]|uniref:histidine kinase n=1 Tax=Candidatus Syntrophocurvum alkaliphilum TaxID=2293317 RepID=A0A6I6DDL3_9FIRM|nr:sensor histidine kinase [Candidatus Syntrophocurvum alkaliphilum]QGT98698.1 Serine phosphatase RsbU, regulator of sigma subunit [Candidatus Syntrophocurvum alkaliphilum]
MKKSIIKTNIIIICLTILFTCMISPVEAKERPEAISGLLDLTNWDFKQDGVLSLDGQWEFYWQELLTPDDLNKTNVIATEYINVPMSWNKQKINNDQISGQGYATYRLLINTPSDKLYGIKVPRIFTSYNLWVDDKLVASNGTIGSTQEETVPQYLPQVKYFKPNSDTTELVVQVANFHHRSGGILESLQIGTDTQISDLRTKNIALELFLFGSLFIIAFYHFGLFLFRTKDKSTLFFGVFSLLIALRTLLVGEIYFIYVFPNFSWEIAHKIQTLAYYMGVPLIFLFLKSIFPKEFSTKVVNTVLIVGFSFSFLVLLTPAIIFTQFNPIFQLFSIVALFYATWAVFTACYKKREGAYLIGLGVIFLFLFTINDIIYLSVVFNDSANHFLRNIIVTNNLSSWGLLIFIFTQSLVLASKFSQSFTRAEFMKEELQQLNEGLEQKVKNRTYALENSKKDLEKAYKALTKSEKSRQNLVQNISHDLRTPLTSIRGYVSAILDGLVKEPEKQQKYLNKVIDKTSHLDHLVQQLMDLSRLESRQLKLDFKQVPIDLLMKNIIEKYSFDFKTSNGSFQVNYPLNWESKTTYKENLFVLVDIMQLDRVLTNLFTNALAHTQNDDQITLSFDLIADNKKLLIAVADTGTGICTEDLPHIFERFYMAEKARQQVPKNSGLGLAISKEIIEYHGGQIWVNSKLGQGSKFYFTLPVSSQDIEKGLLSNAL